MTNVDEAATGGGTLPVLAGEAPLGAAGTKPTVVDEPDEAVEV